MTPLRVSFFGGGTDFPAFYNHQNGLVVSMAIQEFIYVSVKRHSPLFGEKYRISYYETEHVNALGDIKNSIARSCIELIGIEEPLFISTSSDIPAMSGLGSSSSFAVGLLNALHVMQGQTVSAGQLAEEACEVELNLLGKPIGKQDQYAAAFGGLNSFEFRTDGRVSVDAITLDGKSIYPLDSLVLVWTGMQRSAESILMEQNENTETNRTNLVKLKEFAATFKRELVAGDLRLEQLASMLNESWSVKRNLASNVSSEEMNAVFSRLIEAGALGGKLLGAGGGGFFLACVPLEFRADFTDRVNPLNVLPVTLESMGSRVLSRTFR